MSISGVTMFGLSTIRGLALLIAGTILSGGQASAGWICIKNESDVPLVIQEIPEKESRTPGRMVRLLPGEVYREYQPAPGERQFQLLDWRHPLKPLFHGLLRWPKTDISLRICSEDKVLRFLPVRLKGNTDPEIVTTSNR